MLLLHNKIQTPVFLAAPQMYLEPRAVCEQFVCSFDGITGLVGTGSCCTQSCSCDNLVNFTRQFCLAILQVTRIADQPA